LAPTRQLAVEHGADYVKTSTGFGGRGVTLMDVTIIKGVAGDKIGIKASAGINTPETARELLDAGATRLGSSASLDVIGAR
jgi:deoxyribose-phosphate aldolase